MKSSFLFALIVFVGLSSHAKDDTRTKEVHGDRARNIMEALSASGFEMKTGDEFSSQPITIEAKEITCEYTAVELPDDWMSDARCYQRENGADLPNPLALAKALSKYAEFDAGLGHRYLSVDSVACVLDYNSKNYKCAVKSHR